jgi:hypothetical protein
LFFAIKYWTKSSKKMYCVFITDTNVTMRGNFFNTFQHWQASSSSDVLKFLTFKIYITFRHQRPQAANFRTESSKIYITFRHQRPQASNFRTESWKFTLRSDTSALNRRIFELRVRKFILLSDSEISITFSSKKITQRL